MKNAYLILAHNEYRLLEILVGLLDDYDNDIYIHINKRMIEPDREHMISLVNKSNLYFVDNRVPIYWGNEGVLYAEFELLKKAIDNGKYDYYHLITGSDLPIKTNKEINTFFENNIYNNRDGKKKTNYLVSRECKNRVMKSHVCQYNFFIKYWSADKKRFVRLFFKSLNRLLLFFQWGIGIDRFKKKGMRVFQGDSWWSITDDLAKFILDKEYLIKQQFNGATFGADEYAIQSFVSNSEYANTLYDPGVPDKVQRPCLRELDFSRGNGCGSPHVYTEEDYELLIESKNLFARKFIYSKHPKIVDDIVVYLRSNSETKE